MTSCLARETCLCSADSGGVGGKMPIAPAAAATLAEDEILGEVTYPE